MVDITSYHSLNRVDITSHNPRQLVRSADLRRVDIFILPNIDHSRHFPPSVCLPFAVCLQRVSVHCWTLYVVVLASPVYTQRSHHDPSNRIKRKNVVSVFFIHSFIHSRCDRPHVRYYSDNIRTLYAYVILPFVNRIRWPHYMTKNELCKLQPKFTKVGTECVTDSRKRKQKLV